MSHPTHRSALTHVTYVAADLIALHLMQFCLKGCSLFGPGKVLGVSEFFKLQSCRAILTIEQYEQLHHAVNAHWQVLFKRLDLMLSIPVH